jgi:hypothetical protein
MVKQMIDGSGRGVPGQLLRLSARTIGARCRRGDAEALLGMTVLEFDIKGLFDNIDHPLLLRAVRNM